MKDTTTMMPQRTSSRRFAVFPETALHYIWFVVIFLSPSFDTLAQPSGGTVDFRNWYGPGAPSAPVTNGVTGQLVPAGNPGAFVAGLYWGPLGSAENSLTLAIMTSRWTSDGLFDGNPGNGTLPVVLPVDGGTTVALQIRVWQRGFSTYEAAAVDASLPLIGKGNLQVITTGNASSLPTPPTSLVIPFYQGDVMLQPITLNPMPEPRAGMLLLVGAGLFAAAHARRQFSSK